MSDMDTNMADMDTNMADMDTNPEFTSARREAARSMEPDKGGNGDDVMDIDMAAALCEKYNEWSKWSSCTRKCDQTRVRRCRIPEECGRSWVKEKRTCIQEKGTCYPLTYKVIGMQKRNRLIEELLYDILYAQWTAWGPCTRSCRQRRQRECKQKSICVRSYIQEERRCQFPGSQCEHRFSLKPLGMGKSTSTNSSASENDLGDDDEDDSAGGADDNEYDSNSKDDSLVASLLAADVTANGSHIHSKPKNKLDNRTNKKRKLALEELTSAQKECGIRPKSLLGSYRVVGGQEVKINSWPWQNVLDVPALVCSELLHSFLSVAYVVGLELSSGRCEPRTKKL
nr:suppressor of tumorigenicity 14 protein-like protein [Biomphalaria glabrata]